MQIDDKEIFNLKLGGRIKRARNEFGFSLEKLNEASGLNLSKGSFSAMENGRQQISAYQLFCISKALNTSIESLVGDNAVQIDVSEEDIKKINEI